MTVPTYEYPVSSCDVPSVRHRLLEEYRRFRTECLESLRGDSNTSVMNQIHDLTWHTAVFPTLNEARRLEPSRTVSGAMWELVTAGYAHLMALGIRRLVDTDSRADSLWNVLVRVEKRPELLTRELFVCHDGLPFDTEAAKARYYENLSPSERTSARYLPNSGPGGWAMSELLHDGFDKLHGKTARRKRTDRLPMKVVEELKEALRHPAIKKVCTMADKRFAHAERFAASAAPAPTATYDEVDQALQQLVRVVGAG